MRATHSVSCRLRPIFISPVKASRTRSLLRLICTVQVLHTPSHTSSAARHMAKPPAKVYDNGCILRACEGRQLSKLLLPQPLLPLAARQSSESFLKAGTAFMRRDTRRGYIRP